MNSMRRKWVRNTLIAGACAVGFSFCSPKVDRLSGASTIIAMYRTESIAGLKRYLEDRSSNVKNYALMAIANRTETGKIDKSLALRELGPLLINLLDSKYEYIRGNAAKALGKLGDVRAVDKLCKMAEHDTHKGSVPHPMVDNAWVASEALREIAEKNPGHPNLAKAAVVLKRLMGNLDLPRHLRRSYFRTLQALSGKRRTISL